MTPRQQFWKRFYTHKPAVFSLCVIGFFVVIALLGYTIIPDTSNTVNQQCLPKTAASINTQVTFLYENSPSRFDEPGSWLWGKQINQTRYPIDPNSVIRINHEYQATLLGDTAQKIRVHFYSPKQIQNITFLLGTDGLGRDLWSRLVIGTRVSMAVGLVAVFISLLVGIILGSVAGYFGGWIDMAILWLIQVFWSIPGLMLVMAISIGLGKGIQTVFIAVGLGMWVEVARVVRAEIRSLKEREYILAAQLMGFSPARVIFKHLMPALWGPLIILSSSNFANAILVESGLSFLGLGIQPPMPSLGSLIRENYPYLMLDSIHLALIPSIVVVIMVMAFNWLGNGLNDAFRVKQMVK
jgi:ABC-type dipeptide/oligopeptide/nickel transport system permease subunit